MRRPFFVVLTEAAEAIGVMMAASRLSAIMIATIFFFNAVVPLLFSKTDKHLFGNYNMKTIHQIKLIVNIL